MYSEKLKLKFFSDNEDDDDEKIRKLLLNTENILDTLIKKIKKEMKDLDSNFLKYVIKKIIRKRDKNMNA